MSIKVLSSGLSTTIQDQGRAGYAACGVPESGFMDDYTAMLTNLLAGNEEREALMEITVLGPKLYFAVATKIVLGGLEVEAVRKKEKLPLFEVIMVEEGDMIDIKRVSKGNFAYLAVCGGLQTEERLNSRCMCPGITKKHRLEEGDVIPIQETGGERPPTHAKIRIDTDRYWQQVLPVYPGPEFGLLTAEGRKDLLDRPFTVTADCNRMGFSFEETVSHRPVSMLTGPVLPGTIQLTSGGNLIVLMRDAQVTGGYPRILQLQEDSLGVLAQKRSGEKVTFQLQGKE